MADILKAGFGKGKIVFPQEIFPVESFIGVHDDPCARVMAFQSGGARMAIAALEMVNVPPKGIDMCRDIIADRTGTPREQIWVHITHAIATMHLPGPKGPAEKRPPLTERDIEQQNMFYDALKAAVTKAAEQAAESFGEARIGWGSGNCEVNINRDVETPYGWWTGHNPEGTSNKKMTILRVDDTNGAPKGFLISYGIKPCAIDNAGMETQDRQISSDVCGVCSRMMEERFGAPALFCVSAAGDQVPREQAWFEEATEAGAVARDFGVAKGLEISERLGSVMGQDAIGIAEQIECTETEAQIRHHTLSFPWIKKAGKRRSPGAPVKEYPADGECTVEAEILTLGDAAFVAEKPEVNCQTELELIEKSPFSNTCLICMVNGEMKYMPDRLAYEHNTFECQSSMLQPGAAEKFVEEVAACLNEMH